MAASKTETVCTFFANANFWKLLFCDTNFFVFSKLMVIVRVASRNNSRPVGDIKTDELQPYYPNETDPYITAYFNVDSGTPSTFTIGDGKTYEFDNINYTNNPLKQNSSYIVFLRFFGKEVNSMQADYFALRLWTQTKISISLGLVLLNGMEQNFQDVGKPFKYIFSTFAYLKFNLEYSRKIPSTCIYVTGFCVPRLYEINTEP